MNNSLKIMEDRKIAITTYNKHLALEVRKIYEEKVNKARTEILLREKEREHEKIEKNKQNK